MGSEMCIRDSSSTAATRFADLGRDAGAPRWCGDGHQAGAGGQQQLGPLPCLVPAVQGGHVLITMAVVDQIEFQLFHQRGDG